MLNQRLQFGSARLSLALVGLMWVLPFLYPYHAYPVTTFYQEWLTALLGVLALPLLLTTRFWQAPQVPGIVLLPIGMMMLLLLQFIAGQVGHFDQVLLLSLYFLFAALLMMLGHFLRAELGLPQLAAILAAFLLVGAELNTLAGILQHYRWHTFLDGLITGKVSAAVFGNIAQPNHYANYIALGLCSLGLLHTRFGWRAGLTALLATPMLFVLVLSGSRSAWLYLSFILLLAWLWQRRDRALRPLFGYAAALWLGYLLMHGLVQLPWLQGGSGGSVTAAERLFGEAASGSIRLHLWREAGLIFAQYPLFGAGFGQFAWQHLLLAAELHNPGVSGLYNNAHNIVFQLAAETGLAGLAVLFVTLGLWAWQAFVRRAQFTPEHWWGYAVLLWLGYLLMHGLVQLPWLQGGSGGSVTAAERLFGEAASGSIRLHLWREAGLIFAQYPLFGAGFGQFAWQHLLLAAELHNPGVSGLYNNAHNIVFQLAAETGLAGLAVLFVTLGLWAWQAFVRRAQFTPEHWWGYAVLAVLAIHSLLEYPLWYAYFIGIAAFLLGAFDETGHRLELRRMGRFSVAAILVLGVVLLWQGLHSYRHLENASSARQAAASGIAAEKRAHDELLASLDYPLFSSYGQLFIAGMMEPSEEKLAQKLSLNGHALRFIPTATLSYHQAWLLAWSEQPQAARNQLERSIWA
ncbi:MAG: hypothetical protein CO069_04070, partial [Gallionellaceae bacterium CG_4_9_14_0_8_um_filter_60_335]